ncbi:hypothetical protein [Actinocrispum sp. NPDC049592]|uniref:hypothetical protein n=1 Tax=Actinocrispum sp. NPDC049592 TaxID=3154835 RepID=UPI003443BD2B
MTQQQDWVPHGVNTSMPGTAWVHDFMPGGGRGPARTGPSVVTRAIESRDGLDRADLRAPAEILKTFGDFEPAGPDMATPMSAGAGRRTH